MFVSKCMHHSLGVKQCLLAIRLQVEACYPRCHREVESILHMLRDCPLSKAVWHQLGNWLGPLPWNHVFLFGIWLLWKYRNLCIFKNKNPNPNLAKEIIERALEFFFIIIIIFFCANNSLATKRMILKSIRWEKLRIGWLTLNTNGSTASSSGSVGGGGLIRDEKGD